MTGLARLTMPTRGNMARQCASIDCSTTHCDCCPTASLLTSRSADVRRFVDHWRTKFDWRAHEKRMNELPNFKTTVEVKGFPSIDMHFVHQKSGVEGAIPLLFVHGWPGSFMEASKILPLLKGGNGKPAFDVVVPSLPNYGFSGAALKKGFGIGQYAEACHNVMMALGYDQ